MATIPSPPATGVGSIPAQRAGEPDPAGGTAVRDTPAPAGGVAVRPAGAGTAPVEVPGSRVRALRTRMLPAFLGAAAVGAAAVAATGMLLTPPSASPLPTPATTGPGAPVPPGAAVPAAGAARLVEAAAGTGLHAADPVVGLTAWRDNGGLAHLTAIGDGFERIAGATGRQDAVALAVACGTLRTAIDDARGYDPVPDPVAGARWADLLTHGSTAATACQTGALTLDGDRLAVFTEQADLVRADLTAVAERVRTVLAG